MVISVYSFGFKAYVVKIPLLFEYLKKLWTFYMYRSAGNSGDWPASVQCLVGFKYRTLFFP